MLDTLVPIEETRAYKSIFAKGETAGKAAGQALLLKRMIARRFGALPDWAGERIDAALSAQLEGWAEAMFDAADIEQLLGPQDPA